MAGAEGIVVIGLAAPTCAGKTSLIEELQRRMQQRGTPERLAVLSFDEYDLYPAGSPAMAQELAHPTITNWEDPRLFDVPQFVRDLGKIARGQSVELLTRSRESLAAGTSRRLFAPAEVNIIEGLFVLLDPEARTLMDVTGYIDIPPDEMVERRLATLRPGSEGNPWDDPDYIRGPMVEGTRQNVLPQREVASLVLDGLRPTEELADIVMQRAGL